METIAREKEIIAVMIRLYCRQKHHTKELCDDCAQLLQYAHFRLDKCPYGNNKSTCKNCTIHCYKSEMREKINDVMCFSGPRMLLHHPFFLLGHLLRTAVSTRTLFVLH